MLKFISTGSYAASAGILGALALGVGTLTAYASPGTAGIDGPGLRGFSDKAALDAFVAGMQELEEERYGSQDGMVFYEAAAAPPPIAIAPTVQAAPSEAVAEEAADASAAESITNTQEVGVDEGGIVKQAGEYLVILRRGRLFTVHTGSDTLDPVDTIDAFPPQAANPGRTWYDEMLVSENQVIVLGYSYGSNATEVNRFDISDAGALSYRDTHYLRSGDYYSSSNYASRLIGDELILYAPVYAQWGDLDRSLPAIREFGEDMEQVLVEPQEFLVAEPYRDAQYPIDVLHTVTRCDLSAADLDCSATAIAGTWSRAFYVSREAVYAWTGTSDRWWDDEDRASTPGQLYRIPLDGSRPGAVQVAGAPVDQFSFAEDAEEGVLRILLRGVGNGEGMWASEHSAGEVSLATVPFDTFRSGMTALARADYRELPRPTGHRFHNRFVGDYLLYAAADYRRQSDEPTVYAVPLDGRGVQEVKLAHGVTRFDRMGRDGVVVGPGREGALGFTSLSLGAEAKVEDTYLLAAASEGETRSQAFFYKPDRASADGLSGTLGLPIARRPQSRGAEFLGSGSAIAFLRRESRKLSPAGELAARSSNTRNDNCIASCVDWYGNARPIFMGNRIFALMGYEIVEGEMSDGQIRERQRISFTPGRRD